MATKEMTQKGRKSSQTPFSTPPDSPDLVPSARPFTSNDAHRFIEMGKTIVASVTPPNTCSHTPPEDNTPNKSSTPLTMEHLEKLIEKLIQAKPEDSASKEAKSEASGDAQPQGARASKLEFKMVNKIWDAKEYKYKIEESQKPGGEVDELDQYVFIVRARIDRTTAESTFYIDIKSEGLRDILRVVLQDVRVSLREDKPTVEQNLLFHYLPELELCHTWNDVDPIDYLYKEHLELLIDYVKTTYQVTTQHLASLLQSGQITYNLLWALLKPNSFVYTTCVGTGAPRCVKYDFSEEKETQEEEKYYNLDCRYLDFNGEEYGEASIQVKIPKFHGIKSINSLPAFPLKYHRDMNKVYSDLVQCGQRFLTLRGPHHRYCHGRAFLMKNGKPVRVSVDGRILIDAAFFQEMRPNNSRPRVDQSALERIFSRTSSSGPKPRQVKSNGMEQDDLKDDDLLICCPTVPGFSLDNKLWVEFAVADIKDIEWSSSSFNCLTIPCDQREVIVALAEAHTEDHAGAHTEAHIGQTPSVVFDDFVEGKGRGLIVLLHGMPGLGKTLTVEALSEYFKRPLYSISVGELGNTAEELEFQLSQIFRIASHWKAILLLDEADVFLEQRSSTDVFRNGLVSVFLRKLEYYNGILFLTTNRVSQFDGAILSRINLMVKYDDLSKAAGRKIWQQFLEKAHTSQGPASVKNEELTLLVNSKLNGRQIKNTVATARALAKKQKSPVCFSHLRQAISASKDFIIEFNGGVEVSKLFL